MKKWILFFFVCLSLAGLGHSQTLIVASPNGDETWPLGSMQNINWTSSGVTADVKLVLFKGGTSPQNKVGNIVQNLTAANGSYLWKAGSYEGGTVAVGSDYYVRVIAMDGSCKDESNGPFSIIFAALAQSQIQAAEIRLPPRIIRFAINDGAETTAETSVTLNHRVMGGTPTHYRLQIRGHWRGWASYPYPEAPVWNWSPALGENTLVFQVKNGYGESNVATDAIIYDCNKEFTVYVQTAAAYCSPPWEFRTVMAEDPEHTKSIGFPPGWIEYSIDRMVAVTIPQGRKAEFLIFGGRQLNERWTFVSFDLELPTAGGTGYRWIRYPSAGSRDISLQFRIWHEIYAFDVALMVKSITLKGPCNGNIADAFR